LGRIKRKWKRISSFMIFINSNEQGAGEIFEQGAGEIFEP
jgi:hypothetical protein